MLGDWSSEGRRRWLQAAAAGRWEDSRGLDVPAAAADVRALVGGFGEGEVAVEFEWLGHPLVFVGARRPAGELAGTLEDAAARLGQSGSADPALALEHLAGGAPSEIDHVELGAANAWRSVGPLRLWTRGEDPQAGRVAALLAERPELRVCAAPVALEVSFRQPRSCWIGREVSDPAGDGHVVDVARVEALLQRLFPAVSRVPPAPRGA
jgi:hypothetical protein